MTGARFLFSLSDPRPLSSTAFDRIKVKRTVEAFLHFIAVLNLNDVKIIEFFSLLELKFHEHIRVHAEGVFIIQKNIEAFRILFCVDIFVINGILISLLRPETRFLLLQ